MFCTAPRDASSSPYSPSSVSSSSSSSSLMFSFVPPCYRVCLFVCMPCFVLFSHRPSCIFIIRRSAHSVVTLLYHVSPPPTQCMTRPLSSLIVPTQPSPTQPSPTYLIHISIHHAAPFLPSSLLWHPARTLIHAPQPRNGYSRYRTNYTVQYGITVLQYSLSISAIA